MTISRRKPQKLKNNRKIPKPKTPRIEMRPETRAFIAGAMLAGHASSRDLARTLGMKWGQTTIAKAARTIKLRAEQSGFPLWDPQLYQTELGRGRKELLTPEQKKEVIRITTQDREHREKESWQAIKHGDYSHFLPEMSISTLENIMYEAGYARRRPGWKPSLTPSQEKERYQWALAHNPDKDKEGDNKGFNFREVCFTDETPARVGEQRGMQRTWCKLDEVYDNNVKKDRSLKYSKLQFFGAFRYDYKGPCHVYYPETKEEKEKAEKALKKENQGRRKIAESLQVQAREALNL